MSEVRKRVDAIVREHLKAVGFYDNRDGWAEETTRDLVNALLREWVVDPLAEAEAEDAAEWRRVALEAWRHYRDNVWPSSNDVARQVHAHHLAKMIPFLAGAPDEAWLREAPEGVEVASFSFNLREMNPSALAVITGLPVETVMGWTTPTPGEATFGDARYAASPEVRRYRVGELPKTISGPGLKPEKAEGFVPLPKRRPGKKLCGALYDERTPPCSVAADWPHEEHSNGEWHWRTPRVPEWVCKCPAGSNCGHAVRDGSAT